MVELQPLQPASYAVRGLSVERKTSWTSCGRELYSRPRILNSYCSFQHLRWRNVAEELQCTKQSTFTACSCHGLESAGFWSVHVQPRTLTFMKMHIYAILENFRFIIIQIKIASQLPLINHMMFLRNESLSRHAYKQYTDCGNGFVTIVFIRCIFYFVDFLPS